MQSRLFCTETARRLRVMSVRIVEEYCAHRYHWMSAFQDPDCVALAHLVGELADSVETDDVERYRAYVSGSVQLLLDRGVAPIVLLAAADIFERAVIACVTPDQWSVIETFFTAARESRQINMRDWIDRVEATGA